jgi:hypothetical protein
MKNEALLAGGILVVAVVAASFTLDGERVPVQKLAGGSEACIYHAGPKDADLINEGSDAGQRILRSILDLDHKCEYVTLALPDGSRQIMKLGKEGRAPGAAAPPSITTFP